MGKALCPTIKNVSLWLLFISHVTLSWPAAKHPSQQDIATVREKVREFMEEYINVVDGATLYKECSERGVSKEILDELMPEFIERRKELMLSLLKTVINAQENKRMQAITNVFDHCLYLLEEKQKTLAKELSRRIPNYLTYDLNMLARLKTLLYKDKFYPEEVIEALITALQNRRRLALPVTLLGQGTHRTRLEENPTDDAIRTMLKETIEDWAATSDLFKEEADDAYYKLPYYKRLFFVYKPSEDYLDYKITTLVPLVEDLLSAKTQEERNQHLKDAHTKNEIEISLLLRIQSRLPLISRQPHQSRPLQGGFLQLLRPNKENP